MHALSVQCNASHSSKSPDLIDLSLEQLLQIKISSATRREEALFDIPSTVYVIDQSKIKKHGFRDLKDVLKFIPGVEYAYPHSWLQGGQRGFSGNWSKTKIMIDGIEVNLLYSGEAFIGHQFMTDNIERVEVIQGPGSSLYGADAYAGLINIVTKKQGLGHGNSALSYRREQGGQGYAGDHFSIYTAKDDGAWQYSAFVGHVQLSDVDFTDFVLSTDFSEPEENRLVRNALLQSGQEPYVDDNIATNVNIASTLTLSEQQSIKFNAIYLRDEDGGGLESPDISLQNFKTIRDQRLVHVGYTFTAADDSFNIRVKAEHHNADEYNDLNFRELIDGGLSDLYIFDIVNSTENIIEAQFDLHPADSEFYTVIGGGYREKELPLPEFALKTPPFTSVTDFASLVDFQNQNTRYVFAQTQASFLNETLDLIAGVRKDEHNIYDAPITPRVGLTYKPKSNLAISVNYGEAFRAPTMFELETNPRLGPAKQKTYEVSAKYSKQNWSLQSAIYRIDANDLIVTLFDSSRSENFMSVNKGEVEIQGLEISTNYTSTEYQLDVWVDWTDSTEQENITEWQAGALGSIEIGQKQSLSLALRVFGDTNTHYLNSDFEESEMTVSQFFTLDTNWVYADALGVSGLDVNVNVRNLLDEDASYPNVRGNDPKQFKLQGINASFGIQYEL